MRLACQAIIRSVALCHKKVVNPWLISKVSTNNKESIKRNNEVSYTKYFILMQGVHTFYQKPISPAIYVSLKKKKKLRLHTLVCTCGRIATVM